MAEHYRPSDLAYRFLCDPATGAITVDSLFTVMDNLGLNVSRDEVSQFLTSVNYEAATDTLKKLNYDVTETDKEALRSMSKGLSKVAFENIVLDQTGSNGYTNGHNGERDPNLDAEDQLFKATWNIFNREKKTFISEIDVRFLLESIGAQHDQDLVKDMLQKETENLVITKQIFENLYKRKSK